MTSMLKEVENRDKTRRDAESVNNQAEKFERENRKVSKATLNNVTYALSIDEESYRKMLANAKEMLSISYAEGDKMFVKVSDEQAKVYRYLENLDSVNNARQSCPYKESYGAAQELIRPNSANSVLGV